MLSIIKYFNRDYLCAESRRPISEQCSRGLSTRTSPLDLQIPTKTNYGAQSVIELTQTTTTRPGDLRRTQRRHAKKGEGSRTSLGAVGG